MDEKLQALKALVSAAFWDAKYAHECALGDPNKNTHVDKVSALSYAAACTARSSAAAALYWSSPELAHFDVPALLAQFDTFTNEIRDDFKTDHSRQWVDIEFGKLSELYYRSIFASQNA